MSMLLTKRLARSLWRSKLRLFTVILLIMMGVTAGISFGGYAHNVENLYDVIYADDDEGVNLPDAWIILPSGTWSAAEADGLCDAISDGWSEAGSGLDVCEPRLVLDGVMFHVDVEGEEAMISSVWHGTDEGLTDKVWIPDHECCGGRIAGAENEIVIDRHVAKHLEIEIGDSVEIGSGHGRLVFEVVGIGFHSNHLWFTPDGSIFPPKEGTFATGYLSAAGLERLAALDEGAANYILIDVQDTPAFDLPDTDEDEGQDEMTPILEYLSGTMVDNGAESAAVRDRGGMPSIELLRVDLNGAKKSILPMTIMLTLVAGITIALSLHRLISSQAREIAILRTLGIPSSSILIGYIIAPLVIGAIGVLLGLFFAFLWGVRGMLDVYENIIQIPILTEQVPPELVLKISLLTMLVVFIAGIQPAWKASRLQPLEVLGGEHQIRLGSRWMQRLTARLPATIGLIIRSSLRKPVRLGVTFFAVGLSMLIFGSVIMMNASMAETMIGGLDTTQQWDVTAYTMPGGEAEIVEWAEANGAGHELLIEFPGGYPDDSKVYVALGLDTLTQTDSEAMRLVNLLEGRLPSQGEANPEVLIDEGMASILGWEVGDSQILKFGSEEVEVEVVGISRELMRTITFHRADLAPILGIEATGVYLSVADGTDISGLGDISLTVVVKDDVVEGFTDLMNKQSQMLDLFIFIGIGIAAAVLLNTLLMNLAERDSDLATLRVLGASRRRLALMLLGEHIAIGLVGGILGAIMAIYGAVAFAKAFSQWAFYFVIEVDPYVASGLVAVVVAISIAITPIGIWRIHRMDLVDMAKGFSS
ncbi:MAG: FtsX-like permease family protein [Candidatus Poseidoniales archaeon]|nr:FtsX-like permease family protein [Candidatus Poseidoniales archaeon]